MPAVVIDTREFSRALRDYLPVTKRTFAEALNKKAYRILWKAYTLTDVAVPSKIRDELMQEVTIGNASVPLAYAIVQKRTKQKTGRGLNRTEMPSAVRTFINKRIGHRTFMKSGWIAGLRAFAAKLGLEPKNTKWRKPKGGGTPAKDGFSPKAVVWNEALSRFTSVPENLEKKAGTALKSAIAAEVADMDEFIARQQQKEALRFVSRLIR